MSKHKLVFATGNKHKLEEVNLKLESTKFYAEDMKTLGVTEDIPETGATMRENAWQKASYLNTLLCLFKISKSGNLTFLGGFAINLNASMSLF